MQAEEAAEKLRHSLGELADALKTALRAQVDATDAARALCDIATAQQKELTGDDGIETSPVAAPKAAIEVAGLAQAKAANIFDMFAVTEENNSAMGNQFKQSVRNYLSIVEAVEGAAVFEDVVDLLRMKINKSAKG